MITVEKDIVTKVGNIKRITMERKSMKVVLLSYGASIYSIEYNGREMTLKPNNLDDFLTAKYYYGKTVGRTSGRLMCPSYAIDHIEYPIKPHPEGEVTTLHGGAAGFSYRDFELLSQKEDETKSEVVLRILSEDMEGDYPGDLTLDVRFVLNDFSELLLEFSASTNKDTLCNITNHTYFNLSDSGTILDHEMMIKATDYVVINDDLIPQRKDPVKGTIMDLNEADLIRNRVEILKKTPILGYDNAFLLQENEKKVFLRDTKSNTSLTVTTDYPSAVVFTHNLLFVDSFDPIYKEGLYTGVAIECQFEPYGIHFPDWNQAILRKGESYQHYISYQFN